MRYNKQVLSTTLFTLLLSSNVYSIPIHVSVASAVASTNNRNFRSDQSNPESKTDCPARSSKSRAIEDALIIERVTWVNYKIIKSSGVYLKIETVSQEGVKFFTDVVVVTKTSKSVVKGRNVIKTTFNCVS